MDNLPALIFASRILFFRLLLRCKNRKAYKGFVLFVSLVIIVPDFRAADLSEAEWKKVKIARANIGGSSNKEFLIKLVDDYNESRRTKGRDII